MNTLDRLPTFQIPVQLGHWAMPRRRILSARQRSALLDLPTDESSLLRHYILADAAAIVGRARVKTASDI